MTTQTKETVSISKSTCERYTVETNHSWAIFLIDAGDGMLSIQSDYGNWGHSWSSPGKDFKKFLCELDDDYLLRKLCGNPDKFNAKKTVANIKKIICESRRERLRVRIRREWQEITKEWCRNMWDSAEELEDITSADVFAERVMNDPYLEAIGEHITESDVMVYERDGAMTMFMERLWRPFIEYLKAENMET